MIKKTRYLNYKSAIINHNSTMNIVVMGPQGSGKTTQAELLAEKLSVPLISTGAITREIIEEDTKLGKRFRKLSEAGILLDDADVLAILNQRLEKQDCVNGFVLDGAPRTLPQAQKIENIDKVFYIKISDEVGIERLTERGRVDDTPEAIKERLSLYHLETEPVLDFYREKGILQEVDGERTVEEIQKEIGISLGVTP